MLHPRRDLSAFHFSYRLHWLHYWRYAIHLVAQHLYGIRYQIKWHECQKSQMPSVCQIDMGSDIDTTFWSEKYRKVTKEKRRFYFEGNYSVNWGQDNIKLANYRKNTATKTRTTKKWQRKRFKAGVLEVENKWVK